MTTLEDRQDGIWKAGEVVPPGTYIRVDDCSYRKITLTCKGPLPATFDGHVALYGRVSKIPVPTLAPTQMQTENSQIVIAS